jgi:hypothetical protein
VTDPTHRRHRESQRSGNRSGRAPSTVCLLLRPGKSALHGRFSAAC